MNLRKKLGKQGFMFELKSVKYRMSFNYCILIVNFRIIIFWFLTT